MLTDTTPQPQYYIPTLSIIEQPSPPSQEPDNITSLITEKSTYTDGDWIVIRGQTNFYYPNSYIRIIISDPSGNVVTDTQALNNNDNTFSAQIHATGQSWTHSGTYQVTANYGGARNTEQFSFMALNTLQSSSGISVNMNPIILTPERHVVIMTVLGLVSNNLNQMVEMTIKNQDGTVMEDRYISPANDNTFTSKIPITNKYSTGTYYVSATYGNSNLGSTSFQVVNQITIPEFRSLAGMILAISTIGIILISRKIIH